MTKKIQANEPIAEQAAPRGQSPKRRGTIIVLALAVLAVLALVGVSYVTFVQIERDSAFSASRSQSIDEQINKTNSYIGSLLAADLFGNKIVDASVPLLAGADGNINPDQPRNARIWPKAFEDGEFYDAPTIDPLYWADSGDENSRFFRLEIIGGDRFDRVAPQDDAWLASSGPDWDRSLIGSLPGSIENTDTWHQITNIRTAYLWVPTADDGSRGYYERLKGEFVDLGEFFRDPVDGRANAGVDFLERALAAPVGSPDRLDVRAGWQQDVWGFNMAELSDEVHGQGGENQFTPLDERQWVDTDGDLRPDARWTQLESLGNLFGLVWFVAVDIKDASALANINAAIEFPHINGTDFEETGIGRFQQHTRGTGETPADIDLYRILSGEYGGRNDLFEQDDAVANAAYNYRVQLNRILSGEPYRNHLEDRLGVEAVIAALQTPTGSAFDPRLGSTSPLDGGATARLQRHAYGNGTVGGPVWSVTNGRTAPLTAQQRRSYYEFVGHALPTGTRSGFDVGYSARELLDLRAYTGTNNSLYVSMLEQTIDGPDGSGFLPDGIAPAGSPVGPLRARADASVERDITADAPSDLALWLDPRRHLTPVSGVANYGPVPVVNEAAQFDGDFYRTKVSFHELAQVSPNGDAGRYNRVGTRVFETFMYFLAPFSVRDGYRPGFPQSGFQTGFDQDYFYGGGTHGPASRWLTWLGTGPLGADPSPPTALPTTINADFAFQRALSLTVNLFDANDADDRPTVFRYYPSALDLPRPTTDRPERREGELTARLAFGNVADDAMNDRFTGSEGAPNAAFPIDHGVYAIGLERYPVIREVVTFALYQDDVPNGGVGSINDGESRPEIDASSPAEQAGSVVAFELANPWNEDLSITTGSNYVIRLQHNINEWLQFELPPAVIPAGQSVTFFWHSGFDGDGSAEYPANITVQGVDNGDGFPFAFEALLEEWQNAMWLNAGGGSNPLDPSVDSTLRLVEIAPGFKNSAGEVVGGISGEGVGGLNASEEAGAPDNNQLLDRVVFQDFVDDGKGVAVLLLRRDGALGDAGTAEGNRLLLVDRLIDADNLPGTTGQQFFGGAVDVIEGPGNYFRPDPNDPALRVPGTGSFRAVAHGSLTRPSFDLDDPARTPSFPRYMLERPENNRLLRLPLDPTAYPDEGQSDPDDMTQIAGYTQAWDRIYPTTQLFYNGSIREGAALGPLGDPDRDFDAVNALFPAAELSQAVTIGIDDKNFTLTSFPELQNLEPFQIYIPNAPMYSPADVLMTSVYSTLHYVDPSVPAGTTLTRAHIGNATGPGAWVTVGEQLAADYNLYSDQANTVPNPYFGVLNPVRYQTARTLGGNNPPGGMASHTDASAWDMVLPPALRLVDAFEALNPGGPRNAIGESVWLAAGRVNLNTVTQRVVDALPMMNPLSDIGYNGANEVSALSPIGFNSELFLAYRDRRASNVLGISFENNPAAFENFLGLEDFKLDPYLSTTRNESTVRRRGIMSTGELAVLAPVWNDSAGDPGPTPTGALDFFLQPGLDNFASQGPPVEWWSDNNAPQRVGIDEGGWRAYGRPQFNPTDDVEERLAIYRALSNIVSTRSDVYIATYVLRGYDPDQIESITINAGSESARIEQGMNDPLFTPREEVRMLVVFDRSNIRSPIDRPRIIFKTPLPEVAR